MSYRIWLVVPILLVSSQLPAQAQKPPAQRPAPSVSGVNDHSQKDAAAAKLAITSPKVAIKVDAPDEMKRTIEMYMKQALTMAISAHPVDKGAQWQIQIVAFDPDSKPHAERFSMAVAFLQKAPYVDPMIVQDVDRDHCLPAPALASYKKRMVTIDVFQSLSTWDGRIGELQKTCKSIAEDFNKTVLVPAKAQLAAGTRNVLDLSGPETGPASVPANSSTQPYEPPPLPPLIPPGPH